MTALLAGKIIVIIGGTSGLGLSAALACRVAGAALVVVGRDEETCAAARRELGGGVEVLCADACDPTCAERAIATAVRVHGRIDGLYHVAGGSGRHLGDGPLHEISDEGWAGTLDWNLTSVFRSNRAAVRQFLAQGSGGSIVNLASVLAMSPSPRHFATHAYAAAKSGIIGFSRSLASYYAAQSIRVNVLAPGLVDTPMAQRAARDETIQHFIGTKQPLDGGRIGLPGDLDAAVVYLLGDGSRFCTGQVIAIDGGWSVSDGSSA